MAAPNGQPPTAAGDRASGNPAVSAPQRPPQTAAVVASYAPDADPEEVEKHGTTPLHGRRNGHGAAALAASCKTKETGDDSGPGTTGEIPDLQTSDLAAAITAVLAGTPWEDDFAELASHTGEYVAAISEQFPAAATLTVQGLNQLMLPVLETLQELQGAEDLTEDEVVARLRTTSDDIMAATAGLEGSIQAFHAEVESSGALTTAATLDYTEAIDKIQEVEVEARAFARENGLEGEPAANLAFLCMQRMATLHNDRSFEDAFDAADEYREAVEQVYSEGLTAETAAKLFPMPPDDEWFEQMRCTPVWWIGSAGLAVAGIVGLTAALMPVFSTLAAWSSLVLGLMGALWGLLAALILILFLFALLVIIATWIHEITRCF